MKRLLLFICILGALPECISAQWNLVASNLLITDKYNYFGELYAAYGTIWAGRDVLWMSPDTGKTWSRRNPPIASDQRITSIHFFDANTGVVGTVASVNTSHGEVFLTRDKGLTWKSIRQNSRGGSYVVGVCFAGSGNDIIAAISNSPTISTTHNGGITWTDVTVPGSYILAMYALPNGNVYALAGAYIPGSGHLLISSDKGDSWTEMPGGIDADCYSFTVDPCDENTVIAANEAAAFSDDLQADIFRTTDRGITWQSSASFPKASITGGITASSDVLVMQSLDRILHSTDRGTTWKNIGGPGNNFDTRCVCAFNNNILFASDSDGSIYRTFNSGGDSITINRAVTVAHFSSARIINDSSNILIHLPLYFRHSGTMNDIDMVMHYPMYSLKLESTALYNGKSFDVSTSQWPGRAALHFSAVDLNAAPDSLLGYINFQWTPIEATCDEILFDSANTHNTEEHCFAATATQPFTGIIGSYKTCGTSGVAENEHQTPLDFTIHPNPARTNIQIEVADNPGKIRYELFDALGITRRNGFASESRFEIDLTGLADGNYYLRINSADGSAITKPVIVLK